MHHAHSAYLETQILTAPPQKLRLMLIEGCLRSAQHARAARLAGDSGDVSLRLDRARDIVTELIAGIRQGAHPLNETTRAIYAFIFKSLSEAQLLGGVKPIDDAIRVLEEERQTWALVCERETETPVEDIESFRQEEIVASQAQPAGRSSFSLDA
jgi:flagellar protein FliS